MAKNIFIFGSPGSGKSIFSAVLAKTAVKRKKRVIIISGDTVVPMLPFFCGSTDAVGLGALCADEITPQKIAEAVKVIKEHPDIGVIAMQFDDDPAHITGEQLLCILKHLDQMVDVVIWDGTSDIDSAIDRAILQHADLKVCILTADLKGILYFENYRCILRAIDRCILLEGMAKPYTPYEEMSIRTGGLFGRLYYGRELERICLEGRIFSADRVCHEKYYELAEKVMEQAFNGKED